MQIEKLQVNSMSQTEIGNFDDIQEVEFVKFGDKPIRLRFTSGEFLVDRNQFGSQNWTFSVVEGKSDKLLSITSKRLMLKLKMFHPLEGKVLDIERIGQGMETDYNVSLIG